MLALRLRSRQALKASTTQNRAFQQPLGRQLLRTLFPHRRRHEHRLPRELGSNLSTQSEVGLEHVKRIPCQPLAEVHRLIVRAIKANQYAANIGASVLDVVSRSHRSIAHIARLELI